MPRIDLHALRCEFAGRPQRVAAVRDLELSVADREFLVVLGPSGAGKTTLLRLIAGLERPSGGEVRFDGRNLAGVPPEDREVALVFQAGALFPHLSVRENLALGLSLRGVGREETRSRVAAVAEPLGILNLLERFPEALSGGERQRVALGRALVRRPAVLLLDEPLAGLDAPLRRQVLDELTALHDAAGTTTIYVTHDQTEALSMGRRLAVLNAGQLEQCGEVAALLHQPESLFVARFLGHPPCNLLPGVWASTGGGIRFIPDEAAADVALDCAGVVPAAKPQQRVVLGVRPEAAALVAEGGLPSVVEAIEWVGLGRVLRVRCGGARCWIPCPERPPSVGARVGWVPDPARTLWFDPATERRWSSSTVR